MFIVIAYDIVSDRRRQRLAKLLSGYGDRVNYSVFECEVQPKQFMRLQENIAKHLDAREDRVRYYELCANCRSHIRVQGNTVVAPLEPVVVI